MDRSPQPTLARYLIERLRQAGAGHVFGVPGDYVLRFYGELAHSDLIHVGTTREDTAAFAADGYARCRGIGVLAVTYGVGALNVVNAVAGAYAENSPVVVISGAPGVREQREDPLIHHRFGPFDFQRQIFERITCATAVLDDPYIAARQIDRTLETLRRNCQPVYLELPRDRVGEAVFPIPGEPAEEPMTSDPDTLQEAVEETATLLGRARQPVLLAGVELQRRGLQDLLVKLVERARLPVAATITGKSVIGEHHPCYLGVYEGAMGIESTRRRVEDADALLILGATLNDVDTGIYSARLDPNRMVRASGDEVFIRHHRYPQVYLHDFVAALQDALPVLGAALPEPPPPGARDFPVAGRPMTVVRLMERLNAALTPDLMVVCDVGDCLFGASELRVPERSGFFCDAYYTTMGFAVPAALGVQMANPDHRTLILVGDGAFQMTGTELSTFARLGLPAIVVVLNNQGYLTERFLLEGPFNDIYGWHFDRFGEVFGPLKGYDAPTEEAFEAALREALGERQAPSIINVHLQPDDASPPLRRLGEYLSRRI